MFGRVLFALIWLIIAAGVALPLYPRDIPTSAVAVASDPVQPVAGTDAFSCEDCPVGDAGRAGCRTDDCSCGEALPALFIPLQEPVAATIAVTARAPASRQDQPQPLPVRLPAI